MFAEQRAAPRAAIRRRNRSRRARFLLGLCCLAGLAAAPAAGDGRADSQAGAFCGQVLDLVSAKPVADATVAVQDKDGKVIAWTKTDGQGRYSVAADTLAALDLRPTRHRGLLADI